MKNKIFYGLLLFALPIIVFAGEKEAKCVNCGNYSNFDIVRVSNAIKDYDISSLPSPEPYVGDFVKISDDDLEALDLNIHGNYYVNSKTGEVYDIDGKNDAYDYEGNSISDIYYHSIDELKQISSVDTSINKKALIKFKEYQYNYITTNEITEDGAILSYTTNSNQDGTIIPYFANITSEILLDNIGYYGIVRNYILWYLNSINLTPDIDGLVGSIYDYKYENGVKISKNKYDSVESYASTFLAMLYKYYSVTGDKQLLINNKDKIELIINVFDSTFREDKGLTYAKLSYKAYFLMDNVESYNGYDAISNIYQRVYNDSSKTDYYQNRRDIIAGSIETKLWNTGALEPQYQNYDWAYQNSSYDGIFVDKDLYPYTLAQAFPVLGNLIDANSDRGRHLYYIFTTYTEPAWYLFSKPDSYPHMRTLLFNLKYADNYSIYGANIDVMGERTQAINRIIAWSDLELNNYGVRWTTEEAAFAIKSVDVYLNKNYKLDSSIDCSEKEVISTPGTTTSDVDEDEIVNPSTGYFLDISALFIMFIIIHSYYKVKKYKKFYRI